MEIEEYRKHFVDEIRFEAEHDGTNPESMFIEKSLNELEELGELNDSIPMSVYMRGRGSRILAFDAYAYNDADASLVLIASDFSNQREAVPQLTNSRIEEIYSHMLNFIDEAVNDTLSIYCTESDSALLIGEEFKKKIGSNMLTSEIKRFKFLILSDAILSRQVKDLSRLDFLGRPVELCVWTIERFFQNYLSISDEVIEIKTKDFDCNGIQSMKANVDGIDDSYLCVMPGKLIANIYLRYGTSITQYHIGSFKGIRGRNNKGIRQSVINRPKQFFELNNGIVAIAKEVELDNRNNIVAIRDFQIINGCQTVTILTSAIMRHETRNDLQDLFVPMKLIVVNTLEYKEKYRDVEYCKVASNLSESSHSQLSVNRIDFCSNHPFHILLEKLSRKVFAPPTNGRPNESIWFYERSRGRWEQEQFKMSIPQIRRFCESCPKEQIIRKEKLAKCYNTILLNPYQVCQSSAINFSRFAIWLDDFYGNHRDDINENFYKKCVCSVIIFDSLDGIIKSASWYQTGNKAQIIPYTISKLMSLLPTGKDLNWNLIWKRQGLYPELSEELQKLALLTDSFLKDKAGKHLVSTTARLINTWNDFRMIPYELNDKFLNTLILK